MNLRQQFVKGVFWSALQSWGRQIVNFLIFLLLARLLEPKAFGLLALANIFLAFLQLFLDQGFTSAIIQRQKLEEEHLDTAFWTNIGISLLLITISLISANTIANLFHEPNLTLLICGLSGTFFLSNFSRVQSAIFERQLNYKILALRSLIAIVAGGCVAIIMALMGFGVWSLVGQQLVNNLVEATILWFTSNWRPKLNFSWKHFRELFSFGINIVGIKILDFGNRRSDDLLIGYFLGSVALGYYTIAYRVLLVTTHLLSSVTAQVTMPTFSRLQEEPERLRKAFYKITELTSLAAFPTFFGIAVLAPQLVPVLFGDKWLPSIPVMQILAFIGIIHSVTYFNGSIFLALGKPSWKLKLNFVHATANIIGFIIAVRWGIVAVATVYVIRSYLLTPIDIWLVRRLIQIKVTSYLSQFFTSIIGSLGMVGAILMVKQLPINEINESILLSIYILVGTLTYGVIVLICQPKLLRQIVEIFNFILPIKTQQTKK